MGWPDLQLVMLRSASLDPVVVRQAHLHDRAVTRTAVTAPYAISHGQVRGIAHHQSAQEPRERGRALAVSLCTPPFAPELHLTPTTQHGAFQSSALRQFNHLLGSADGQPLSSLCHCLGWPCSLECVHHCNKVSDTKFCHLL